MKQYIDGALVNGAGDLMHVYNPATGQEEASFSGASSAQALEALQAAQRAFAEWSALSIAQRERHILRLADAIESYQSEVVDTLIAETGKPMATALYDFGMLVDCLRYFNEEMKRMHGQIISDYDNSHTNLILRKPIGVVAAYLAWNFPLLNVGYKLGPILASGYTCVLKPASITPLSTLLIGRIANEIGFPRGVINIISGPRAVCEAMNRSPIPSMLTLIGSSATGREIIAQSATSVKRFSLELGGNAPVVVLDDADIDAVARMTVRQKFDNCGQVCVSPNRVFVPRCRLEEFLSSAADEIKKLTLTCFAGDGQPVGPLSSAGARERVEALVADAVEKGARLIAGGQRPDHPGYYYYPTLLAGVTADMRVYREEIFGPVMPVIDYGPEDDVVALANDTEYGLAAYLYTHNLERAMEVAQGMRFGSVCVNEPFYAFNLPHGGVKESGVGKDCSHFSLEEYLEVRRISIRR